MSDAVSLTFEGLAELKAELRNLPATLHGEASHIVLAHANAACLAIRSQYHQRTGELVEHVVVEPMERSDAFAGARVISLSPLSFIYEKGTKVRQNYRRKNANRGQSPPHPVFITEMQRERAYMYDDLRELMRRNGLTVTG